MTLTFEAARSLRDGAIVATSALDEALRGALAELSPKEYSELKHAIGRAMAAIFDEVMSPAISAYPELEPDEAAWVSIAHAREAKHASAR